MAGIYLHIPFCRQACSYCDFHFSTLQKGRPAFVKSICREIELRKKFFPEATEVKTLYFGGGTPGILDPEELEIIFKSLHQSFDLSKLVECTLEVNPDDVTYEKLECWKNLGINRFSLGVQSFRQEDLILLNRAHNSEAAVESIVKAKEVGFTNFSIDLMYGLPNLSIDAWENNLRKAIHLDVPHVSVYALSVEEKTQLAHQVKKGEVVIPDDENYVAQFNLMIELLESHGFHQYEISNFAKPGFESRHNAAYWQSLPYLGLGPSAHSFIGNARSWNVSNNSRYTTRLDNGELPIEEKEMLTEIDQYNEYVMTRLRLKKGIDVIDFQHLFGENLLANAVIQAELWKGNVLVDGNCILLSAKGKIISDGIIRQLFKEVK